VEFISFLPLNITIQATLFHAPDCSGLMVRVKFPDTSSTFYPVYHRDIKPEGNPLAYSINTQITVQPAESWPEKYALQISIVKMTAVDEEMSAFDRELVQLDRLFSQKNPVEMVDWVELSSPHSVLILPKSQRD